MANNDRKSDQAAQRRAQKRPAHQVSAASRQQQQQYLQRKRISAPQAAASSSAGLNAEVEYLSQNVNTDEDEIPAGSASIKSQSASVNQVSEAGRRQDEQASFRKASIAERRLASSAKATSSNAIAPRLSIGEQSQARTDSISGADSSGIGSLISGDSNERRMLLSEPSQGRLTKNLVWAVLVSAVGSSFQQGYNGGVVNAPEKLICQFINETLFKRSNGQQAATKAQVDLIFAIVVSIFCIGGCLGALSTALIAERLGRKQGLFYNNLLVLLACPMMVCARALQSYELLIVGRLIIGINAGLNAGLAPLYLNEISPINLRGALGTIYQLIITISILLSNILGLPALLGTTNSWPLLFAIPLLPAGFMLATLPHLCESPKYLLQEKGRELQAQQALAWFRQTGEIQDEMEEMRTEHELSKLSPPISLSELMLQSHLRKPMIISVVIMLSQQFSGINAVLFFSTSVFRNAGLSEHSAVKATLGMSLVNVLMTLVSLILVDRAGRRTLHITGLMGMAVSSLVLAACLGGQAAPISDSTNYANQQEQGGASSVLAVLAIYAFIVMFASGPGSIPWFLTNELFPSYARPLASSVAVAVNWLANFTVSLCFLPLSNLIHGFTFLIFASLLLLFSLFTYIKLPETKGASSEEISAIFKR